MAELSLPRETSWKLLAVSPDMMDTNFGNRKFPFRWRSSLAISAFEPKAEDMPAGLCEGRLTFLKITATITGYQPTDAETRRGFASFPNVPAEELQRIIGQYFACYGALLTVAVFPNTRGPTGLPQPAGTRLEDFPHIIDFEPKNRELIQAASETGEILTSSKSNIKTNKSLTHTESSENGFAIAGLLQSTDPAAQVKSPSNASLSFNHKNTESEQENWTVATDASRERLEKQGSTTQVSQLYNLLSSYHLGTNRAQFLMLARPHVLEPTDHRTFVNGLRQIEGIQEFILIVARPADMPGLCVEAQLETGHFPEGLAFQDPEVEFDEAHEDFIVTAFADDGWIRGNDASFEITHDVRLGWVVDTRPERGADPGHEGMRMIADNSNSKARETLENHNYRRIGDGTVSVSGRISSSAVTAARFNRTYRVFTRSLRPRKVSGGTHVPIERLLITSRTLSACFKSGTACPILDPGHSPPPGELQETDLVAEMPISISSRALPQEGGSTRPAARALLAAVGQAMTTSWRLPQRHSADQALGFLESDYFKDAIRRVLPRDQLARKLSDLGQHGAGVARALGESATLGDVLALDLPQFCRKVGYSAVEAARIRGELLGIVAPDAAGAATD